ncbi:MAG: hypothetical protein ACPGSD_14330 [Flavobacteriales bacterium]
MQENNNKALKRVVLLVVIVLPSVFYLLMTMGKHNFIYLPNVVYVNNNFDVDRNGKEFDDKLNYKLNLPASQVNQLQESKTPDLLTEGKKIYAVQFFEKDSANILDASLFYKAQTQLAEKVRGFDVQLLTFYRSKNGIEIFNKVREKIDKKFTNWSHVQLSTSDFDFLKNQVFIEPVKSIGIEDSRKFVIFDKNWQMRTGYDKQNENKYIFAYDAGREYDLKLIVEDLKLLVAEYQRELKNKKENEK